MGLDQNGSVGRRKRGDMHLVADIASLSSALPRKIQAAGFFLNPSARAHQYIGMNDCLTGLRAGFGRRRVE